MHLTGQKARGAAVIYLTSSNAEREKRTYEEIVLAPVKRTSNTEMSFPRNFRSWLILDLIYAQLLKEDRRSTEAQYDTHIWERIKDYQLDRCGFKNQIDRKNHTFILNV